MAYHWLIYAQVAALIGAFDRSNLIFTRRSNDLIFQTAAIKLFLPKAQRRRYAALALPSRCSFCWQLSC